MTEIIKNNSRQGSKKTRNFMFVIDDHGIECWFPADSEIGYSDECKGKFAGLNFYKMRAAFNWDRGCYYMEVELSDEQLEHLKKLLLGDEDWLAGKEFIESITGRNFQTETGYANPFDPDWKWDFGPNWQKKRNRWLKRAGFELEGDRVVGFQGRRMK